MLRKQFVERYNKTGEISLTNNFSSLQDDKETIIFLVSQNPLSITDYNKKFLLDRDVVLSAVRANGHALELTPIFQSDKEIVLEALKTSANTIRYASEELKNDKDVAIESIKRFSKEKNVFNHIKPIERAELLVSLRSSKVQTSFIHPMNYISKELKNDKEFATEVLKYNIKSYIYLSETLRGDLELAYTVALQEGILIQYSTENVKNNKEIALEAVLKDPKSYEYLSDERKQDFDILCVVVMTTPSVIKNLSFTEDEAFMIAKKNPFCIEFLPETYKNDDEFNFKLFKDNYEIYPKLSKKIRSDFNVTLEAVSKLGKYLISASDELKQNEEIVLPAMRQNKSCYAMAHSKLKSSKEFSLKILEEFPDFNISLFPNQIKDDDEVMNKAISINGSNFEFVSPRLSDNKELLLKAINNTKVGGFCLIHASDRLRCDVKTALEIVMINPDEIIHGGATGKVLADRRIVVEIVKTRGRYLEDISHNIKKHVEKYFGDEEIATLSVKSAPSMYRHFVRTPKMKQNFQFSKLAIELDPKNIAYAPEEFSTDRSLVQELLSRDGSILQYLKVDFQNDRELVEIALKNTPSSLRFASEKLQGDEKLFEFAIQNTNTPFIRDYPLKLRNNKKMMLEVVRKFPMELKYLHTLLQQDKDVVLLAVEKDGNSLQFAGENMKNDVEVVLKAIQKDVYLVNFATQEVRYNRQVILQTVKLGLSLEYANWNEMKQDKEIFWFFSKRHELIRNMPHFNISFKFSYFLSE